MPFDIPGKLTHREAVEKSLISMNSVDDPHALAKGRIYSTLALALAISEGFANMDDIGDALKTVAVEIGAVSIAAAGLERAE